MCNTKIHPFYLMKNVIQNYAWGSRQSISHLFNIPNPDQLPQAEIWMGAHPGGCSQLIIDSQPFPLDMFIQKHPSLCLSEKTHQEFGELPFLFKVLAAEKALSIQVHPCKEDAKLGFEKENELQIPCHAPHRNYKDPNHKPELVYALTDYHALNGFRPLEEIVQQLESMQLPPLSALLEQLVANKTEEGFRQFFIALLSFSGKQKSQAVQSLLFYAEQYQTNDPIARLILELSRDYPDDIGLFAPTLLHYIVLKPGDAMYLDAKTPHAYLKGTGLEVMANSDNVLRAGLTPKHIDVTELAKCTSFAEKPREKLLIQPESEDREIQHYTLPVRDFKFSIYHTPAEKQIPVNSAEIIFAIDSEALLQHIDGSILTLRKGQSAFVPATAHQYRLTSSGRVARVYN